MTLISLFFSWSLTYFFENFRFNFGHKFQTRKKGLHISHSYPLWQDFWLCSFFLTHDLYLIVDSCYIMLLLLLLLSVVKRHIQRYFSYIVTGQMSSFQILTCCRAPTAGVFSVPSLPRYGHRDVFYLLAIRGPTRGEGKRVIEPGSYDPKSSPLPLRHRGGRCIMYLVIVTTRRPLLSSYNSCHSIFMGNHLR